MRYDLIALNMFIKEMGLPTDVSGSFANRLKLQKALYLIQLTGVDLGYRFSWYLRGPYSTALAKDLFELESLLQSEEKEEVSGYQFTAKIKSLLSKSVGLLQKPAGIDLKDEEWYELLASLHFLKHIAFIPDVKDKSFDVVYKNLTPDKQNLFGEGIGKKGWDFLEGFKLIKNKKIPS